MDNFNIKYIFYFDDNKENKTNYQLTINKMSKTIIDTNFSSDQDHEWTDLNFYQCTNCSLDPQTSCKCPIAIHLNTLVKTFADKISYNKIKVITLNNIHILN